MLDTTERSPYLASAFSFPDSKKDTLLLLGNRERERERERRRERERERGTAG